MNTIRRSLTATLVLALCLSAMPLYAQAPPAFLIEKIDVRNVRRASPQVVRSESLLREGQAYTERELQDAQSRIRRLPFVLDVEFSLEKGSQRDVYVLVMDVDEASPFFVGVDHNTYFFDGAGRGRDSSDQTAASAGLRWFTGDFGQLHANLSRELDGGNAQLGLGYTQYNLLGRAIFLSAAIETNVEEHAGDAFRLQGVLGIPIRGNHAARFELNGYRSLFETRGPTPELSGNFESRAAMLSASWIYDSTNDALFPTDGTYWLAGGGYGQSETSGTPIILPGTPSIERDQTSDYRALNLAARKFWPIRELDAICLQAGGQLSETSRDFFENVQATSVGAQATYSGSLWGLERTRRYGDLRYEAGVRATWWRTESPVFSGDRDYRQYELVTGLAHRNRWGLFRINVGWQLDVQTNQGPVLP